MSEPTVVLVWAMAENGVIGRNGDLPWHLPDDLRRFKALTAGHPVVMGRATWESLPIRPLSGRRNVVLSRNRDFHVDGAEVVDSLETALSQLADEAVVCIIGGASVYEQAMPVADRLELTLVHAEVPGDTTMPSFDPSKWVLVDAETHPADDRHRWAFTFQTWERTT